MGLWSSVSSITSSVISSNEAEQQAGTAKGELFPDFDTTVERLKNFDLEAPLEDKTVAKLLSQSNRIKKT